METLILNISSLRMMKFIIVFIVLVLSTHPAASKEGGATSGGGNDLGIFALREFGVVSDAIEKTDSIYTQSEKALLQTRSKLILSVLIVEEDLPASGEDHGHGTHFIQKGTAWSTFDGTSARVYLNAKKFAAMADPIAIDGLLHHELAVLAGIEKTGDYTYTDRFMDFREKEWSSRKMICTASVFDKTTCKQGEVCPGKLRSSAATRLLSFGSVSSGVLYLENLVPETKHSKAPTLSRVLRYVSSGGGYFRAVLSEVVSQKSQLNSLADDQAIIFSGSPKDITPEITYYNVYDWMSASREARLRDFGSGFLMISCARF